MYIHILYIYKGYTNITVSGRPTFSVSSWAKDFLIFLLMHIDDLVL